MRKRHQAQQKEKANHDNLLQHQLQFIILHFAISSPQAFDQIQTWEKQKERQHLGTPEVFQVNMTLRDDLCHQTPCLPGWFAGDRWPFWAWHHLKFQHLHPA